MVEIQRSFKVSNSTGCRHEIVEVRGGVEIKAFDQYSSEPYNTMFLSNEDVPAIFMCLGELVELDEPGETDE